MQAPTATVTITPYPEPELEEGELALEPEPLVQMEEGLLHVKMEPEPEPEPEHYLRYRQQGACTAKQPSWTLPSPTSRRAVCPKVSLCRRLRQWLWRSVLAH